MFKKKTRIHEEHILPKVKLSYRPFYTKCECGKCNLDYKNCKMWKIKTLECCLTDIYTVNHYYGVDCCKTEEEVIKAFKRNRNGEF